MRHTPLSLIMAGGIIAVAVLLPAQAGRRPGLWEVTSRMTWEKSPIPGRGSESSANAAPHTATVCLTQAMIDKYGGPIPQAHGGECQLSNVNRTANGMTADWSCTSRLMNGKGTIQSSWTDDDHARGKVHFVGTMQLGSGGPRPVEWTDNSTSVYKGPDCGSVKPLDPDQPAQ